MLITLSVVLAIVLILLIAGLPLAVLFFGDINEVKNQDAITIFAIALVIGFGISAFASATAYGITGINTYIPILLLVIALNWILLLRSKLSILIYRNKLQLSDFMIFIPILLSVYFSSSQWSSLTKPIIKVGIGPDVSQNLMAAQNAEKVGSTWFEALTSIKKFLGVDSFDQAAMNQFRVPSVKDVASYDYLVFGGRWGVTIPFNQVSKILGPQSVIWETSIILCLALVSIAIIFFAIGKILKLSVWVSTILATLLVANSTQLYQFLNGGLSQLIGTVSIAGLLMSYLMILQNKESNLEKFNNKGIFVLSLCSWLGSIVTYIDSVLVVASTLLFSSILMVFLNKHKLGQLVKYFYIPGFLALMLSPVFTYANILSFKLRIQAASGTGFYSDRWNLPSEQFGFINTYSSSQVSYQTKLLSVLIFLVIVFTIIYEFYKSNSEREISTIALSALMIIGVGLLASLMSNQKSSYIYEKVSLYVAPLILTNLCVVLSKKNKTNKLNVRPKILYLLLATSLSSGIHFQETYFKNVMTAMIPNDLGNLVRNKQLQKELSTYNYLIPYRQEYNYMGLLGAAYWISKAPNDFILTNRQNNELRLICFALDSGCKPSTQRILNKDLDFYGIYQYESPITTEQFSKLSIDEKYNANFDAFGSPREAVPDKFKGGNPYFK
jgi:hypothetical protein